jgi:hypothetical protein
VVVVEVVELELELDDPPAESCAHAIACKKLIIKKVSNVL